jgi:hypothetical protein
MSAAKAAGDAQNAGGGLQLAALEPWQLEADSDASPDSTHDVESLPLEGDSLAEAFPSDTPLMDEYMSEPWAWRWVPEGLVYHTYMAGVHEPRMALVAFYEAGDGRALWDATLGGRVGLLQYGNGDPFHPAGFQIDFYGAAIARLDVENRQDLDSTDYVFGVPFTWGDERLQFEVGYSHLSSHLGDEFAISNPGALADRINYVRDSLEFGTSWYVVPAWRAYGEMEWAFHRSGGAKPLAFQFGTEISRPGPTGNKFVPFVAVNARMRQENDFGGDLAIQAGWLRRGLLGQTLRFGAHYYNGKSSQSQFFNNYEHHIGVGVWYDF